MKNEIGHNTILGMRVDSYKPLYDEYSDYNTNALSYYDYLARYNKILTLHSEFINRLLLRNIKGYETDTNSILKIGDWIENSNCPPNNYDDVISLGVNTKISDKEKELSVLGETKKIKNGIEVDTKGLWVGDYESLFKIYDKEIVKIKNDITNINQNINSILGLNLKTLERMKDYNLVFHNGFFSPSLDLIVQIGETKDYYDIYITSHSTSGKVLKHMGDLRDKTELTLSPLPDYNEKCKVFTLKFYGEYEHLNDLEIALDSTKSTLWHMRPVKQRASWENLLTPHNINNEFVYSWRQISDGYGVQLKDTYTESLSLEWGNVDSKITLKK